MKIDIREKPTEEQIKETFEISVKRLQLYKNPNLKMKESLKQAVLGLIGGILLLTGSVLLGVFYKFDTLNIIAVTLAAVVCVFSIMWLVVIKKSYATAHTRLLDMDKSSLEYDEDGIAISMYEGSSNIRIHWKDIEFIRVFDHMVGVFDKSQTQALIFAVKYKDQVFSFMRENGINVKVVGQ